MFASQAKPWYYQVVSALVMLHPQMWTTAMKDKWVPGKVCIASEVEQAPLQELQFLPGSRVSFPDL